jgi:hypothetical protein
MNQLPLISPIISFFEGSGTDHRGRHLKTILSYNNEIIETSHDIIQWVFPLPEASNHSDHAPILTEADIKSFRDSASLQRQAWENSVWFRNFLIATTAWRRHRDHNHLRITRAIRFLTLVGLKNNADVLHSTALHLAFDVVSDQTKIYWEEALKEKPSWLE